MGISRLALAIQNVLAAAALATNVETAFLTTPPLDAGIDSDRFLILVHLELTVGTAGNGVLISVRRGTTTGGTLVASGVQNTVAAGNVGHWDFYTIDAPGIVAGQQWTATGTIHNANGNSTINNATMAVFAL